MLRIFGVLAFLQGAHAAPAPVCSLGFLAFFCREAHAAPCTPAPAPAGLLLWACWRLHCLLGGNVSQFCALFRLFWRKRDWNCATLAASGGCFSPGAPSLLSSRFVATLGFYVILCVSAPPLSSIAHLLKQKILFEYSTRAQLETTQKNNGLLLPVFRFAATLFIYPTLYSR